MPAAHGPQTETEGAPDRPPEIRRYDGGRHRGRHAALCRRPRPRLHRRARDRGHARERIRHSREERELRARPLPHHGHAERLRGAAARGADAGVSWLASLPHQIPFRAASAATRVDERTIEGTFLCTANDALPLEVMAIEAMAQLAGGLVFDA